jgi:hypothetical protein
MQKVNVMPDLQAAVEDWLAAMPADEFRTLVARTRPPDEPMPSEQHANTSGER